MTRKGLSLLVAVGMCLAISMPAAAQSDDGYDVMWFTIDCGGVLLSRGGGFSLGGAMGQSDAESLSGDGYTLVGGLWGADVLAGGPAGHNVCLPIIMRQS
jgi:hypothetical protein